MGCFEIFDLISGVSAGGGPDAFLYRKKERDDLAEGLSDKILAASTSPNLPGKEELKQILTFALFYTTIVIGKFGDDNEDEEAVNIRRCCDYDSYGGFDTTLSSDGKRTYESTQLYDTDSPFMDSRCWQYLRTWLYYTFANDLDGPELGLSNNLDYGLMRHMHAPNLTAAVSKGLRGKDLVPEVFADLQTWIFESPDVWPVKAECYPPTPTFRTFEAIARNQPPMLTLPPELLFQIFSSMSLVDLLNISSTSKSMRQIVTDREFFSALLRVMMLNPNGIFAGSNLENANKALRSWIHEDTSETLNPLQVPGFPFMEFVYTCLVHSGSMKNRKRIWEMIKQVEALLDDRKARSEGDDFEVLEKKGQSVP
ncbi:hypothetical protein DL96DRAFT_1607635 [Flagelloscypha sp. PMI_526]|nr:hypothetical protein DL96DRAFT_1607635 [Flagelloscypha sp. PMI_526]